MKCRIYTNNGTNFHGASGETIRGPRFRRVKLTVIPPSSGHRFIFYWPSGKWWHIDFYFDRREKP